MHGQQNIKIFLKMWKPTPRSSHQKGEVKPVAYREPTNITYRRKKFTPTINCSPGLVQPAVMKIRVQYSVGNFVIRWWTWFLNKDPTSWS